MSFLCSGSGFPGRWFIRINDYNPWQRLCLVWHIVTALCFYNDVWDQVTMTIALTIVVSAQWSASKLTSLLCGIITDTTNDHNIYCIKRIHIWYHIKILVIALHWVSCCFNNLQAPKIEQDWVCQLIFCHHTDIWFGLCVDLTILVDPLYINITGH